MEVIITRDKKGTAEDDVIYFWQDNRRVAYEDGVYVGASFVVGCKEVSIHLREFKKIFGFLPRTGSKETYKLKLIKTKQ